VTLDTLTKFQQFFYANKSVTVSAVSPLPMDTMEQAITNAFPRTATSVVGEEVRVDPRLRAKLRPDFVGSQMNIRDDTVHKVQIAIGHETFGYSNRQLLTLLVLQALFGKWGVQDFSGNYSSHQLAEAFAADKLVDFYVPFSLNYTNSGMFGVYVETHEEEKVDDVVYEVFNQYQKLYARITPHDIFRAKHQVISEYLDTISTTAGLASDMGKQVTTYGRRIPPEEFVHRISQIDESDVYSLLKNYFWDTDPVVVARGPLEEMVDYSIVRSWTFWNRW